LRNAAPLVVQTVDHGREPISNRTGAREMWLGIWKSSSNIQFRFGQLFAVDVDALFSGVIEGHGLDEIERADD
jgi:hypothetical protein